MTLMSGDVVKKRRGGGTKRCEVVRLTKTHATLRPLAKDATERRNAVTSLVLPLDESGLPEGYEVAT